MNQKIYKILEKSKNKRVPVYKLGRPNNPGTVVSGINKALSRDMSNHRIINKMQWDDKNKIRKSRYMLVTDMGRYVNEDALLKYVVKL